MKESSVPEADRNNLLRLAETWPRCRAEASGGKPRPIRKRGFWRAYRRGEHTILLSLAHYRLIDGLARDLYGNSLVADKYVPDNTAYILGFTKWLP